MDAMGALRVHTFMNDRMVSGFENLDEVADAIHEYNPHRPRPADLDGLRTNLRHRDGRWFWHWDPKFIDGTAALPPLEIVQVDRMHAAVDALAPRVYELSEFLVDVLGVIDVGAYFPHRVTYHPTCHSLRMLRVGDRPLQLLRAVRGLDLVELPGADQCCGFGGTFAMKNADTSVAMGSDKVRHVRDTGAEVLVASDNSCLAHIGGMLSRQRSGMRVLHLAEILASTEEHPA